MIKVYNYDFGFYHQKLIMNGRKIKDITCDCKHGLNNKDMWKNPDKRPCRHAQSALLHHDLKTKNENIQKIN